MKFVSNVLQGFPALNDIKSAAAAVCRSFALGPDDVASVGMCRRARGLRLTEDFGHVASIQIAFDES